MGGAERVGCRELGSIPPYPTFIPPGPNKLFCHAVGCVRILYYQPVQAAGVLQVTSVSEGFFLKCSAIFFRQEIVNQKWETHPVKSFITKQLLIYGM